MAFKETYQIDAKQAERAFKTLESLQEKIGDETEKTTKRLSAQEKQARRIAEMADPQKKYNREMETLAGHVKAGRVNMDDAVVVATKYRERLDHVGRAGKDAFGARAIQSLASYATGLVTVSTVVGGIRSIFATLKQEAADAAQNVRQTLDSVGELQQLSGFSGNLGFARQLRRDGVVQTADQASNLVFALNSGGLSKAEQEFVAYGLVKERFFKPGEAPDVALAAKKAQELLGFGSLKGTFQRLTEASGGVASNIPTLATATTKFGSQFKGAGYSGDEALAAIAVADKGSSSTDAAAERLKSLSAVIDKRGLRRGSFLETINSIRAREAAGENIYSILGEQNAVSGYQLFDEVGEQANFRQALGGVSTAEQRDILGQRVGLLSADPIYGAAVEAERAKTTLDVVREQNRSELQNLFEATRDRRAAFFESRGMTGASIFERTSAYFEDFAGTEEQYLRNSVGRNERYLEGRFGGGGALTPDFEQRVLQYLERSAAASDRTANAVEGGSNPAGE